ncbi:hypothetical protein CYMTET_51785, partial [Cymbomonas tetramitiformis]
VSWTHDTVKFLSRGPPCDTQFAGSWIARKATANMPDPVWPRKVPYVEAGISRAHSTATQQRPERARYETSLDAAGRETSLDAQSANTSRASNKEAGTGHHTSELDAAASRKRPPGRPRKTPQGDLLGPLPPASHPGAQTKNRRGASGAHHTRRLYRGRRDAAADEVMIDMELDLRGDETEELGFDQMDVVGNSARDCSPQTRFFQPDKGATASCRADLQAAAYESPEQRRTSTPGEEALAGMEVSVDPADNLAFSDEPTAAEGSLGAMNSVGRDITPDRPPKRPPGRPRKTPVSEADPAGAEMSENLCGATAAVGLVRTAGRPRESSSLEVGTAQAEDTERRAGGAAAFGVKRPPGRPRKTLVMEADTGKAEVVENLHGATADVGKRRTAGRPPKSLALEADTEVVDLSESLHAANASAGLKRPRGRPPKHAALMAETGEAEVDASLQDATAAVGVKRRPGRPPKHAIMEAGAGEAEVVEGTCGTTAAVEVRGTPGRPERCSATEADKEEAQEIVQLHDATAAVGVKRPRGRPPKHAPGAKTRGGPRKLVSVMDICAEDAEVVEGLRGSTATAGEKRPRGRPRVNPNFEVPASDLDLDRTGVPGRVRRGRELPVPAPTRSMASECREVTVDLLQLGHQERVAAEKSARGGEMDDVQISETEEEAEPPADGAEEVVLERWKRPPGRPRKKSHFEMRAVDAAELARPSCGDPLQEDAEPRSRGQPARRSARGRDSASECPEVTLDLDLMVWGHVQETGVLDKAPRSGEVQEEHVTSESREGEERKRQDDQISPGRATPEAPAEETPASEEEEGDGASLESVPVTVEEVPAGIDWLDIAVDEVRGSIEGLSSAVDKIHRSVDGGKIPVCEAHDAIEGVWSALEEGHDGVEGVEGAIGEASGGVEEARMAVDEVHDSIEGAQVNADGAALGERPESRDSGSLCLETQQGLPERQSQLEGAVGGEAIGEDMERSTRHEGSLDEDGVPRPVLHPGAVVPTNGAGSWAENTWPGGCNWVEHTRLGGGSSAQKGQVGDGFSSNPEKRPRGRPRKAADTCPAVDADDGAARDEEGSAQEGLDAVAGTDADEEAAEPETEGADTSLAVEEELQVDGFSSNPEKRPRGRPRKVQTPIGTEQQRPRGRPRKTPRIEIDTGNADMAVKGQEHRTEIPPQSCLAEGFGVEVGVARDLGPAVEGESPMQQGAGLFAGAAVEAEAPAQAARVARTGIVVKADALAQTGGEADDGAARDEEGSAQEGLDAVAGTDADEEAAEPQTEGADTSPAVEKELQVQAGEAVVTSAAVEEELQVQAGEAVVTSAAVEEELPAQAAADTEAVAHANAGTVMGVAADTDDVAHAAQGAVVVAAVNTDDVAHAAQGAVVVAAVNTDDVAHAAEGRVIGAVAHTETVAHAAADAVVGAAADTEAVAQASAAESDSSLAMEIEQELEKDMEIAMAAYSNEGREGEDTRDEHNDATDDDNGGASNNDRGNSVHAYFSPGAVVGAAAVTEAVAQVAESTVSGAAAETEAVAHAPAGAVMGAAADTEAVAQAAAQAVIGTLADGTVEADPLAQEADVTGTGGHVEIVDLTEEAEEIVTGTAPIDEAPAQVVAAAMTSPAVGAGTLPPAVAGSAVEVEALPRVSAGSTAGAATDAESPLHVAAVAVTEEAATAKFQRATTSGVVTATVAPGAESQNLKLMARSIASHGGECRRRGEADREVTAATRRDGAAALSKQSARDVLQSPAHGQALAGREATDTARVAAQSQSSPAAAQVSFVIPKKRGARAMSASREMLSRSHEALASLKRLAAGRQQASPTGAAGSAKAPAACQATAGQQVGAASETGHEAVFASTSAHRAELRRAASMPNSEAAAAAERQMEAAAQPQASGLDWRCDDGSLMLASPSAARNLDRRRHVGTIAEQKQSGGSEATHHGEPAGVTSSLGDEGNAEGGRWNGLIDVVEQLEGTRDGAPDGMAASSPPRLRGEPQDPQKEETVWGELSTRWRELNETGPRGGGSSASDASEAGADPRDEVGEAAKQDVRGLGRPPKHRAYRGVSWAGQTKKWAAQIQRGRKFMLGYFETQAEAALAYDIAACQFDGENARTNFPGSASAALSQDAEAALQKILELNGIRDDDSEPAARSVSPGELEGKGRYPLRTTNSRSGRLRSQTHEQEELEEEQASFPVKWRACRPRSTVRVKTADQAAQTEEVSGDAVLEQVARALSLQSEGEPVAGAGAAASTPATGSAMGPNVAAAAEGMAALGDEQAALSISVRDIASCCKHLLDKLLPVARLLDTTYNRQAMPDGALAALSGNPDHGAGAPGNAIERVPDLNEEVGEEDEEDSLLRARGLLRRTVADARERLALGRLSLQGSQRDERETVMTGTQGARSGARPAEAEPQGAGAVPRPAVAGAQGAGSGPRPAVAGPQGAGSVLQQDEMGLQRARAGPRQVLTGQQGGGSQGRPAVTAQHGAGSVLWPDVMRQQVVGSVPRPAVTAQQGGGSVPRPAAAAQQGWLSATAGDDGAAGVGSVPRPAATAQQGCISATAGGAAQHGGGSVPRPAVAAQQRGSVPRPAATAQQGLDQCHGPVAAQQGSQQVVGTVPRPAATAQQGGSVPRPAVTAQQGGGSVPRPAATAQQGVVSVPRPAATAQHGVGTVPRPAVMAQQGGGTVPRPAVTAQQVVGSVPRPAATAQQGGGSVPRSAVTAQHVSGSVPRPAVTAQQGVGSVPQPTVTAQQGGGLVSQMDVTGQRGSGQEVRPGRVWIRVGQQGAGAVLRPDVTGQQMPGPGLGQAITGHQVTGSEGRPAMPVCQEAGSVPHLDMTQQQRAGSDPWKAMTGQQGSFVPRLAMTGQQEHGVETKPMLLAGQGAGSEARHGAAAHTPTTAHRAEPRRAATMPNLEAAAAAERQMEATAQPQASGLDWRCNDGSLMLASPSAARNLDTRLAMAREQGAGSALPHPLERLYVIIPYTVSRVYAMKEVELNA